MRIDQIIQESVAKLALLSETAPLDVQLLLAHVLGVQTSYLYTWPEREPTTEQCQAFEALLQRRLAGEPIAYLLQKQAFWTLELAVAPCTLIPRADTEGLVEVALDLLKTIPSPKVLDLGTGTGAVALAIASERPDAHVSAVDVIDEAVQLAQTNAQANGLSVTVFRSDWLDQVPSKDFSLIVSNPPYIDPLDPHLQQGDVAYEPRSALISDNQGFADIKHIVAHSKRYLIEGGWLAFEHGYEQGDTSRAMLTEQGYLNVRTVKDYAGKDRVTLGQWSGDLNA